MFDKILIANRGEIALRVERACKELGVATVAVHSTADADAMHVRLADESVCIGAPPAKDSYLNIPAIVAACEITGADAVHPGYGFLAENARFAEILEEHAITFIGPSAEHVRLMGDKIQAKETARSLGIPVVPGSGPVGDFEEARALANDIGYPVLVKAAAGGGGRGMKLALFENELEPALATARNEARAAFGDGTVYLEKYLSHPRHIEVQVLADGQGNAIHLGERDCSLQRRHQKLWEEAPSPALNASERVRIGETVAEAMRALSYRGVGTVEFLYEGGEFYFIEMNTRLQVEHPVSELLTGVDLACQQILLAGGAALPATGLHPLSGHAIEFRINCEDPARDFRPAAGTVTELRPPLGPGVRFDTHAYSGYRVPPFYDSLLAKLICQGSDRQEALRRMQVALESFIIEGVTTTIPFLARVMANKHFQEGAVDTKFLERESELMKEPLNAA
ncbi:MAG TPA: acetyl-CoA carboxylase biotin carboxylase subunit [Rhizobiales bacterium]|nr:acetyl-CoA carboxylase biotin carboxylase subunit [Hyphomicrobiales bacterium]